MGDKTSTKDKKSKKPKSKKPEAESHPEDNIKPETPSKSKSSKTPKAERKSKKRKQTEFDDATIEDSEFTTANEASDAEPSDTEPSGDSNDDDELLRKHPSILQRFKESVSLSRSQPKPQHDEDHEMHDDSVPARPLAPLPQPIQERVKHTGPTFTGLPTWLEHPETFPSTLSKPFSELGINDKTVRRLKKHGWENAFAVQSAMIPLCLRNWFDYQDLLVQAPTGSGKTLGYALPMIQHLRYRMWPEIRGLVIVPTRELVMQVRDTFEKAASGTGLSIGFSVGGRSLKMERELFIYDRGPCLNGESWKRYHPRIDILITTPGRLVEHIKNTPGLDFNPLRWLVIDEADQLLSQEYQNWVPELMDKLSYHDPKTWPGQADLFEEGVMVDLAEYGFTRPFGYPFGDGLRKVIVSASMTRNMGLLSDLNLNKNPKLIVIEPSDGGSSKKSKIAEKKAEREAEKKRKKAERQKKREAGEADDGEDWYGEEGAEDPQQQPEEPAFSEDDSDPEEILSVPATLKEHYAIVDDVAEKPLILLSLILEQSMATGVLIFTRTNDSASRLARLLEIIYELKAQDPAASTHKPKRIGLTTGSVDKRERKKVVRKFKSGEIDILICSDLISRGLDLPTVANVINYDVPHSTRLYIHRVGRTARAGKEGDAFTLVTGRELKWFVKSIGSLKKIKRAPGRALDRVHVDTGIDLGLKGVYKAALGTLAKEVKEKEERRKRRSRLGGS